MTTNHELLNRITARPDVFGGKPIVRDMRISVELILSLLSQGATQEELLGRLSWTGTGRHPRLHRLRHTVIAGDTLAPVSVGGR